MSLWSREPFLAIRILGREGNYPPFELSAPSHLFVPARDLVWSAVLQPPLPEDWELGEVTTLVPEEVRLYAAIALCERDPWNHGMPVITHGPNTHREPVGSDLTSEETRERISAFVHELAGQYEWGERLPKVQEYSIREVGTHEDAVDLLEHFDSSDQLLLAGVSRLLESFRLMTSAYEPEAAALSLFVSMGAALEFLRLHLEEETHANTTHADVRTYLARLYPEGFELPEYLEEMYEHRVIATHPSGRMGEYWTSPLMVDDIFFLRKHLMGIYRHIILGEKPAIQEPFFTNEPLAPVEASKWVEWKPKD